MGVPTWPEKFKDNVQKLMEALRDGVSRGGACVYAEIPRSTFYEWLEFADFRTQVEDAEEFWMKFVEWQKNQLIKEKYRPAIEKELKSKRRDVYWDKQEIDQTITNKVVKIWQKE